MQSEKTNIFNDSFLRFSFTSPILAYNKIFFKPVDEKKGKFFLFPRFLKRIVPLS